MVIKVTTIDLLCFLSDRGGTVLLDGEDGDKLLVYGLVLDGDLRQAVEENKHEIAALLK